MEIIYSSALFSTPEEIFFRKLLKPSIIPHTFQKLLVTFSDVDMKKIFQNTLNSLNLVSEIPQNCKEEIGK